MFTHLKKVSKARGDTSQDKNVQIYQRTGTTQHMLPEYRVIKFSSSRHYATGAYKVRQL